MTSRKTHSKSAWLYTIMIALVMSSDYVGLVILNTLASYIPFASITGEQLLYCIFGILFFICFQEILNNLYGKRATDVLCICGLFIAASVALYIFFPRNLEYVGVDIPRLLLFYLPAYAMVRSIRNYDAIADHMFVVACVLFAFSVYAVGKSTESLQQGYETHMSAGFLMAFCTLVFADSFLERKISRWMKTVSLCFAIVSCGMVLSFGSRGATVICLLYVFYQVVHKGKNINVGIKVLLSWVILLLCIFWNDVRLILVSLLGNYIQENRTLAWLLQMDKQLDSSGRFEIYLEIINSMKERPIFGYGLYGDRGILGQTYAHNLFIEFVVDFGYPIGMIFAVTYVTRLIRGLKSNYARRYISIIGIYATGMLFFSNSYLITGVFWIALGAIMSMTEKRFTLGRSSKKQLRNRVFPIMISEENSIKERW